MEEFVNPDLANWFAGEPLNPTTQNIESGKTTTSSDGGNHPGGSTMETSSTASADTETSSKEKGSGSMYSSYPSTTAAFLIPL